MNLKGSRASVKPPRRNIVCQDESLLCHYSDLVFLFVFFHLAGESVLISDVSAGKTENVHIQPPPPPLLVPQPGYSAGQLEENVHAFI